ncbi:5,6-dimethylbenzimidazole synthase [Microvirga sp. W0021]|uniref:5,6-dimethylbenzimidazole synthase n=1 Tax=Hohaiivirga grylli TaxID=3133970 RepID=A0ABV0BG79_9HYPH
MNGLTSFAQQPPKFDEEFQAHFANLIAWRRDVRRFIEKPVPEQLINHILDMVQLAPSVGNSQPWRWVSISKKASRQALRENFKKCNSEALANYKGEAAQLYASLKLEGLDKAPLQFAIFCDHATPQGSGLGSQTMPETLDFSVSGMISTFWLYARAFGLGVGWVSILNPEEIKATLKVPDTWKLIAVLCVGWPEEEHIDPEMERCGWQYRTEAGRIVLER